MTDDQALFENFSCVLFYKTELLITGSLKANGQNEEKKKTLPIKIFA